MPPAARATLMPCSTPTSTSAADGSRALARCASGLIGTESRLRASEIRILSDGEWAATAGRPSLKVEVTTKRAGKDIRVLTVDVDVEQDVRLARDPTRVVPVTTWSAGLHVGVLASSGVTPVMQSLRAAIDEFVAAWRKANPRR